MRELFALFFTFMKIGAFSFGGGYAMLPLISRVVAEDKKWATEQELLNYYAVSQVTPGVLAVNVSSFVGAKRRGVLGAVFATLGMIFPSVVIITLIGVFLRGIGDNQIIQNAFGGIRVAVCATLTVTVIRLAGKAVDGIITACAAVAAFAAIAFLGASPVIVAVSALALGALYGVIKGLNRRGKENAP